jgi:nitrous oxidase accessory protein NosD
MKRSMIITGLSVAALALAAWPAAAATTWTVNPGESIQTAINNAVSGDTVNVNAGTYNESLTINKGIILSGAGAGSTFLTATYAKVPEQMIMLGATSGSTITGSVVIEGFSLVMGPGIKGSSPDIIKFRASTDDGQIIIRDNVFNANGVAAVDAIVESYSAHNFVISGNQFVDPKYAVYLNTAHNGQITGNTLTRASIGMGGNDADGNGPRNLVVRNNDISGSAYGLMLANNVESIDFSYNDIHDCTTAGVLYWDYGTWKEWQDVTFHYNNIEDNAAGFKGFTTTNLPILVDATNNWWGDPTGPSGGLADPVTGRLANGLGDSILTTNLHWDGFLTSRVPEPATLAMLALGGIGMLVSRKRSK